jgi:hypothetical protein
MMKNTILLLTLISAPLVASDIHTVRDHLLTIYQLRINEIWKNKPLDEESDAINTLRTFLEEHGLTVSQEEKDQVLYAAAIRDDCTAVKILLEAGGYSEMITPNGRTLLEEVKARKKQNVVAVLEAEETTYS